MAQDKADHHTAHKDCREYEADNPAEGGGFGKRNHHNLPLLGSPPLQEPLKEGRRTWSLVCGAGAALERAPFFQDHLAQR